MWSFLTNPPIGYDLVSKALKKDVQEARLFRDGFLTRTVKNEHKRSYNDHQGYDWLFQS